MSVSASPRMGPSLNGARLLRGFIPLCFLAVACGDPEPGPTVGGNTNWLRACSTDDPCEGSLECECGACTKGCLTDADCEPLANARCVLESDPSASALCPSTESWLSGGMCRPSCQPGGCPEGQACALLACMPLPVPDSAECAFMASVQPDERVRHDELIDLVEQARLSGGIDCGNGVLTAPVTAVRPDPRLFCAARIFADDLAVTRSLSLTDSSGHVTLDRMALAGYSAQTWTEGFGVDASSPAEGWSFMLESVDFCSHFADPGNTDIGVAISGDVYVVTLGSE